MPPTVSLPRRAAVLAAALLAASCDRGAAPAVREAGSPAAPGSLAPNIAAGPDRRVWMTWLEPAPDSQYAVMVASRDSTGAWGTPTAVTASAELFVNWADFPSLIVMPSGELAVHWLQRSGPGKYSYDVRIARSADSGATWSDGLVPHRDSTLTEHGFVSLFPLAGDSLGAIWLDGRGFDTTRAGATRAMALVSTSIAPNGSMSDEVLVDDRICDCCQTSVAMAADGPVVVYRDRSADEIRDVYIARRVAGRWSAGAPVHRDGWRVDFCPVNGPAAAARGETVVVAWFTAARDTARVLAAVSGNGGASFGAPVVIDDGGGGPLGRVDAEMDGDGAAWVTWLARGEGDTASVRLRRVSVDGRLGEPVVVATSTSARASGFPRMTRVGDRLYFVWTEPGTPSRVRFAEAGIPR